MNAPKLLIVDEDAQIRTALRQGLESHQWEVIEAASGPAAVEQSKQHSPDVILLNVSVAGMDGAMVANLLKFDPVTCAIPIIALNSSPKTKAELASWAADAVPMATAVPTLIAHLRQVMEKHRSRKPYVLVVDDEPDLVEILTALLNQQGFSASGAANGHEALDVIRSVKPDAVLLDLDMPHANGWDVLGQMRTNADLANVRVVILTGKDQTPEDRERGLSLGASNYLLKPCPPEAIIQALQQAVRSTQKKPSDG